MFKSDILENSVTQPPTEAASSGAATRLGIVDA